MAEEEKELAEKEGYGTSFEKYIRGWIFRPITWLFRFIPHFANTLTVSRFFITFWAILDFVFYHNPIERQVWFLATGWATDMLDGPMARNNKNVTAFGTIADHTADFILILWMIFLNFYVTHGFEVVSMLEKLAIRIMYTILSLITFGMFLVATGMWLFKREKRKERPDQRYSDFMQEFLLKDLVTTAGARIHTSLAAFGATFYLAGVIWKTDTYIYAGAILLVIQLGFMGYNICEIFHTRYKDRMYKMRQMFQRRVADLEELLRRKK